MAENSIACQYANGACAKEHEGALKAYLARHERGKSKAETLFMRQVIRTLAGQRHPLVMHTIVRVLKAAQQGVADPGH